MLLAGDVGGTKTQLALYEFKGPMRPRFLRTYPTKAYTSLRALLESFLEEAGVKDLEALCLAVAGPVLKGRVDMVNVGWKFSEGDLSRYFHTKVKILNDLESLAFAIPHLSSKAFFPLFKRRAEPQGNIGVIAAGTGLGQAMLIRKGALGAVPVATEGGHTEFAADREEEWLLYKWLKARYGHVSLERVLSGPGLENIYRFLQEWHGETGPGLSAPEITRLALQGESLAAEALDIFVRLYGREAGNLALRCMATGGIFLGGGIAPKILVFLQRDSFLKAFLDKGRLRWFVEKVPVKVVRHPYAVLQGAGLYARAYLRPEVRQ